MERWTRALELTTSRLCPVTALRQLLRSFR